MTALGFCTYEHTRVDTGAVFYVGKGRARRASETFNRNIYWKRTVAKAGGFSVRVVVDSVDEELAFLAEVERIDQLRRIGAKLCNMTDGGEGASGLRASDETRLKQSEKRRGALHPQFGKPKSELTKAKLRAANVGKTLSPETRSKIGDAIRGRKESIETREKKSLALVGRAGAKPSEATRRKMSEARKGKPKSEAMRKKLGDSRRGVPHPMTTCNHCGKSGSVSNMARWHFSNCKRKES